MVRCDRGIELCQYHIVLVDCDYAASDNAVAVDVILVDDGFSVQKIVVQKLGLESPSICAYFFSLGDNILETNAILCSVPSVGTWDRKGHIP